MSATMDLNVGSPRSRVDGRAKVTGVAKYSAEFVTPDLLHGYVVSGGVARGRIASIDTAAAEAVPGVVRVFTHLNSPPAATSDAAYHDQVAPPGKPFRPLRDDGIVYSGQPVALVVAEDFATARHAASLVRLDIVAEPHETDLDRARADSYVPPKRRDGIEPPPKPRGKADHALGRSPMRVEREFVHAPEHHNPMEPHATTVEWLGGGKILVHDKVQGVQNAQSYITGVFGLRAEDVHVVTPFVGGAFGSGLRPQYQLFLAVMASLALERSVRVVLTRDQMFTFGYRPMTISNVSIGADAQGMLQALKHEAVAGTSTFEDYQEVVVNWSGALYHCDDVAFGYELAKLDTYTPADMRAPGAPLGAFAIESAMDEMAHALRLDPLELRLRNYADIDENTGRRFTSRELREACRLGAEQFGWSRRQHTPRSMRDGPELIGWGMASGIWESQMMKSSARAVLTADGRLDISAATADVGTGTYTILTQIAADALGLPMDHVTTRIGDSSFAASPVEGGSWTAASSGTAVQLACDTVRKTLLGHARSMDGSPLANADIEHVRFVDGGIELLTDPSRRVGIVEAMQTAGVAQIEAEETASPDQRIKERFSSFTHSAVFVEVRVDEELGVVRVTRVVSAVAAGKILNPKTARSQIIGGVVFGIGMALHEDSMLDHRLGRFMNHNLGEYHIPAHADVQGIEVIFVEEHDTLTSPIGVKGLGEIGLVGTAAAIANAIFHATGKRMRELPITIDKLLETEPTA